MWVVVQQKTVSTSPETFSRLSAANPYEIVEFPAEVSAEAMFGGEVLSYVRLPNNERTGVSVVYADSVTRRVRHVMCGGIQMGEGYARVHQTEAYVFHEEHAARDAVKTLAKPPCSSVVQYRGCQPLWSSVLFD